jgi:hypothetical protein
MKGSDRADGVVLAALVAGQQGTLVSAPVVQVQVMLEGFAGDKHAGFTRKSDGRTPQYPRGALIRNDRQVSIVSQEELREIAASLQVPEVRAEWVGANLLVQGVRELTALPSGTRLVFPGEAVLIVTKENMPCAGPGRVLAERYARPALQTGFTKAALHRRGVVAVVERAGSIREGDGFGVILPRGN